MEKTRLLIADNEEIFREGLVLLLKDKPQIEVVAQYSTCRDLVEKSNEYKPDIVLISTQLADCNIFEVVKKVKESLPSTKVMMITRPGEGPNPLNILKAGARACISRNISVDALVNVLALVSSGRIIIGRTFAQDFIDEINTAEEADNLATPDLKFGLSKREIEIAKLIANGSTNKEIAKELYIAENTVKGHVKNILKKLELRNREQLAVFAVLQNWVKATNP